MSHITHTFNKISRALGFIKDLVEEFTNPSTTELLYTSLVCPILEYKSSIKWCTKTGFKLENNSYCLPT